MTDTILLIHADGAGNPAEPGTIGHFVLVTPTPQLAVNEFSDGGRYTHADCGPACILSVLAARGQHPSAAAVEAACGTGNAGTTVRGVSEGLGHFGVVNSWKQGNPDPGWIMNPAGGRIIPPSEFPAYLKASQGWIISFASTDPPTPGGNDVNILYAASNGTVYAVFGNTLVPLGAPADTAVFEAAGWKLIYQSAFTAATQGEIAKLPRIS